MHRNTQDLNIEGHISGSSLSQPIQSNISPQLTLQTNEVPYILSPHLSQVITQQYTSMTSSSVQITSIQGQPHLNQVPPSIQHNTITKLQHPLK